MNAWKLDRDIAVNLFIFVNGDSNLDVFFKRICSRWKVLGQFEYNKIQDPCFHQEWSHKMKHYAFQLWMRDLILIVIWKPKNYSWGVSLLLCVNYQIMIIKSDIQFFRRKPWKRLLKGVCILALWIRIILRLLSHNTVIFDKNSP